MYVKIFRQIYDSTLADDWRALITFQQLLILANQHGEIDMTQEAIARTTNLPLDLLQAGLLTLMAPDPRSRSKLEEGRRIVLLDSLRPWGWRLVNYAYYRRLASAEDKRAKDRERIAEKRKKNEPVAQCRTPSRQVADVAQAVSSKQEAEVIKNKPAATPRPPVHALIDFFSKQCESMKGIKPVIAGGKDGAIIKAFLKRFDERGARFLITWFLDDPLSDRLGPSIGACFSVTTVNKWLCSDQVPAPESADPVVDQSDKLGQLTKGVQDGLSRVSRVSAAEINDV